MHHNKSDKIEWLEYKSKIKQQYEISDLGRVSHILGMRVSYENKKLSIDQSIYVSEKLNLFNMIKCREKSVPESSEKLVDASENELLNDEQVKIYRGIVGSLIYASISTRPDITHAVNMLSRYMSKSGVEHMNAARRLLRYLQGSMNYGLVYQCDERLTSDIKITGYCDSDWGGDQIDRKSTTGYCVFINNNLISWNTKKQPTVALSSAEAELMAIVDVIKEIKWMEQLLSELEYKMILPIDIFIDNQSAIKMAENDVEHDRTKHIDIKYHFMKDEIKAGKIKLSWISTDKQLADVFTKALGSNQFIKIRDQMMKRL